MAEAKTIDDIARAYDSPPWWYDARGFLILTFSYRESLWRQLAFFGGAMGPRHLEIGCGTGTLLGMALSWRRRRKLPPVQAHGIDYAEAMLAGARKRFRGDPTVELSNADASRLPFADGGFDSAGFANAYHCLPDPRAALREAFRVLRPGGSLAMNALLHPRGNPISRGIARRINAWGMAKGILVSPYEEREVLTAIAECGFAIDTSAVSGNCLAITAVKPPVARA